MKPSLSLLLTLGVIQSVTIASAVESDTTPAEAYYSSIMQQSSQQQQQQQQQYDDSIERSGRKSDYGQQQALPPATSYSAIIVHNTPERLVKPSDYGAGKSYRTADSGIGDYQKSPREENIMSRDSEYANHMSSNSDALMDGVHPDIMQTLLNQQPQTFDNSGLMHTGYFDHVDADNSWTGKSSEQEADYNSDKNDKYSRKRLRKNRNYKKTYNNNDDSKSHQANFGDREKPLALPSSRLQIQNARPDSIFNVGYSIGIHGSEPSSNSDSQLTKSGSNVHYEGRNTVWKELGSGVEMSVNKRKPKHYLRNDDKESRRIVEARDASGSLPSTTYFYNDASPDNSNLKTYSTSSNGFDHNHALRHSNSFDFSNAINPKTGLPYSVSADEITEQYVPKTDLSAPEPIHHENTANREAHEPRINNQIGNIDKEDSRTPRILTSGVNKYGVGNLEHGIPTYPALQKFSTNYNLIQPPFKSAGAIMYPVPLVLPKANPLPYIPPQGDFAYQNLATLPNALKAPLPAGSKPPPSSSVMAVLVPVNNGHMILPPLLNTQFDLPYYGFYGNVIPPYAPNRFLAGPPHALPIKPEVNLQRNHPITVLDNQEFLLSKTPPHVPRSHNNRKPIEDSSASKHQDLVRYTRGNNYHHQRQRPLQPLHYADELNLFPYVFNEKNKFANFRPGSLEAQESNGGQFVFVSAPQQQRLSVQPSLNNVNPRDVLSPPPLYSQPPTILARS